MEVDRRTFLKGVVTSAAAAVMGAGVVHEARAETQAVMTHVYTTQYFKPEKRKLAIKAAMLDRYRVMKERGMTNYRVVDVQEKYVEEWCMWSLYISEEMW